MLSFLPAILLILASLFIQIFGRLKLRVGSNWLIAALVSVVAWIAMIPIGLLLPSAVILEHWLPAPYSITAIIFQFTGETWIFGFLLVSLGVAVIFAEAKYLDSPGYIHKLTGSMLISGIGLLAILARSELAFVLSWALMDLVEFGLLAILYGKPKSVQSEVNSVVIRAAGILLLIVYIALGTLGEAGISGAVHSASMWGLLFLLVTFRMGVLPVFFPYSEETGFQHGMVTLLRVLPILSTFAFIDLISGFGIPSIPAGFLNTILLIGVIYGSIAWFFSDDELKGRPYWNFSLAVLGIAALLAGKVEALIGIATVLAISGPGLFLNTPRLRKIKLFIVILVLGIITIPFTPSAMLPALFSGGGSIFLRVSWIGSYSLLVAGLLKHGLRRVEEHEERESWMLLFHSIALFFLAFAPWIIVGVNFGQFKIMQNWWLCLAISLSIIAITAIYIFYVRNINRIRSQLKITNNSLERLLHWLSSFFSFVWLSRIIESAVFVIKKVANLLARVMEGDGGILWSFLFLVLLLSLLFTRQVP